MRKISHFGATVLLVDDDETLRWAMKRRLVRDGYTVVEAGTGAAALKALDDRPDLVLLDQHLPDAVGLDLIGPILQRQPALPIIMLTGHASVGDAVEAMRRGAQYYFDKDTDLRSVSATVQAALAQRVIEPDASDAFGFIVGDSPTMQEIKRLLIRVAHSPASTILVTGESGTGKDLVARAVHQASGRRDGAFLNITCTALPGALLESELFGHERGAFTDAKRARKGLLEHADGGTVFLDEIGDMHPELQAKMLRFLEDKAFRRVGGTTEICPDVRVIAATNVDLHAAVEGRRFREDLFYRLSVLKVRLPPLRERGDDVIQLAEHFLVHFCDEFQRGSRRLSSGAERRLRSHSWPGNVRELRNVMERAVLLGDGPQIRADDIELSVPRARDLFTLPAEGVDLDALERSLVAQALERTGGNRVQAGRLLGLNRDQVRYRVRKFGLE